MLKNRQYISTFFYRNNTSVWSFTVDWGVVGRKPPVFTKSEVLHMLYMQSFTKLYNF